MKWSWCPCWNSIDCRIWVISVLCYIFHVSINLMPIPNSFYYCIFVIALRLLSSVQSLSHIRIFLNPWTGACQASLSIPNSQNLLKLMSIESVMQSNHLILYHPPSPPAFSLSQNQGFFQWVSSSHQVTEVLEFHLQHQPFQWIFRTDFL